MVRPDLSAGNGGSSLIIGGAGVKERDGVAKLLGIDTGGTYTDAVLFDEASGIIAAAKDLTTKHDLTIGVRGALDQVLPAALTHGPCRQVE